MVWADARLRGQLEELRRKAAKEAASQYGAAFGASFAATYASIRDKARARLALKVPLPTPCEDCIGTGPPRARSHLCRLGISG